MSQAADLPMDNASQQPMARGPSALVIAIWGFFGVVSWLVVAFQSLFIVPRFEKLFMDFKLKLPLATEWVMQDLWWFASACLFVSIVCCIVPRSRWVGLVLLVVVPLVLNLLIVASLYFPYTALVEGLGGNAPKL